MHAAADTEYDWPFYGNLVGAWFASHPAIQQANVKVEDRAHAATAHLPQTWTRTDEWYNYRTNARSTAHVLATPGRVVVLRRRDGRRPPALLVQDATAAAGPSTPAAGTPRRRTPSPAFRAHLLGGIRYAAGRTQGRLPARRPATPPLYNGSTTGWSQAGPGSFTNSDATLTSVGGMGLFWYSAKQFTNYSLKLDWKLAGDDNSGVFIGFPPSSDPWSAVDNGYEIQIDATDAVDRTTGAVYTFKSADVAARDAALNPPGEWNTYELLVEGERLQVFLNGVKINDFTNTDPVRSLAGHIGIQNHGTGDDASFRNIRIKELGTTPPPTGNTTIQAEAFSSANGVTPFTKAGANGGQTIGYIDPGDWAAYNGVDLTGVTSFTSRVVSGGAGGTIQVRTGSATGPVLGSVAVPNTGSWTTFANVTTALSGVPSGAQNLYLTFTGSGTGLFDVDDFTLVKGAERHRRGRPGQGSGRQVPGRAQRRHRRRHADPDLHLQRQRGADLDRDAELDRQGARQVPGRVRQRHRRRHQDPALDLQRHGRAELGGPVRRQPAQRVLGQVPGRVRQHLGGQHGRAPLDLQRRGQPEVDPALTD